MFQYNTVYPRLKILEAAYPEILKEMLAVQSGIKMRTWPEAEKFDGSWKVFGLYHGGRKLESCCKLCPITVATIESIGKVTMAGFSRMDPDTDILPHFDDVRIDKRVHLGLKIPLGDISYCGFEVDGQQTRWEPGKAFVFDPRKIHKAWNKTSEERVVLLIDFENFS